MNDSMMRVPSPHLVRACVQIAEIVGDRADINEVRESYWRRVSAGIFSFEDYLAAEQLLLNVGLLMLDSSALAVVDELRMLAQGEPTDAFVDLFSRLASQLRDDRQLQRATELARADSELSAEDRDRLLLQLGQIHDDAVTKQLGLAGEIAVVDALRAELTELGRTDLARQVRHVSLESDQLGYDIWAPRLTATPRLIEVKTTLGQLRSEPTRIVISRAEFEVGSTRPDWFLVVCDMTSIDTPAPAGTRWCRGSALTDLAPVDGAHSKWESASLLLSKEMLHSALPAATL